MLLLLAEEEQLRWVLDLELSVVTEVTHAPLPALVCSFNDDHDLAQVWVTAFNIIGPTNTTLIRRSVR